MTKSKSKYKTTKYRKRRNSQNMRALPLGQTFKLTTRYIERQLNFNPGAGGLVAPYVFSMNGLYDPNITGVGHQPIGFDQLVGVMYDHYTVIGAKITVTATNTDTTYPQDLVVFLKDGPTTTTDVTDMVENGMCKYKTMSPAGSGGCTQKVVLNCNTSKFFGKKVLQEVQFAGTNSANPAEQVYAHVVIAPGAPQDTSSVYVNVQIDFISVLTEPKQLIGS